MKTACNILAIGLVVTLGLARALPAQVMEKKTLTLDGARQVIAGAMAEAKNANAGGVIAVVDDGGNLIALERRDGTFAAGANVSIGKARTAALFRKPTSFFEKVIRDGRTPMVALDDFTPLQGGVPIEIDGQIVGAVGVSGASSAQQDEEFALAGARALGPGGVQSVATSAPQVTKFRSADVTTAFAKGLPLVETDQFKVHASRRDTPGMAEVHRQDTDIFYVLEGSAVLVTGGAISGGKETGPGEVRGTSIDNGETQRIGAGEVIIIPAGVPHWFKEVSAPLLYYTVKVS